MFQLTADIFNTGGSTYQIWQSLLTFANTGMIIILLVIVFSQLTGYGIDNYGIKKMLPKLIVTAILINLSFLLCQIAIDLSNIIGKGIVDVMKGITGDISGTNSKLGFGILFTGIFSALAGPWAVSP